MPKHPILSKLVAGRRPRMLTSVPGPKARAVLARDSAVMSTSNGHSIPIVADHGEGVWLTDVDGNEFLDMMAGIATNTTGYGHPHVVRAVSEQAAKVAHMCAVVFPHDPVISLAERLNEKVGGGYRVFFGNSGTEGIEAALKFARYHTHRPHFLAFTGAFHGRSAGALSLTASQAKYRKGYGPMAYPVTHVPFPNPFRPPLGSSPQTCGDAVLAHIESLFQTSCPPEDVAAVVIEPIQGEGGYIVPPDGFLKDLNALMKRHGILTIVDEVQTGVGRTGTFYAYQAAGITPDVIVSAKGLASGYPLSATLIRAEICNWPAGAHGSTFGGNPVSCAAAHATLDLVERDLMANARSTGALLLDGLRDLQAEFPRMGDVRGRGLMIGIDFVDRPGSTAPDGELRDRVQDEAFKRGLLTLSAGPSALRMAPPLVLRADEAEIAIAILAEAMGAAGV